jgi:SAM-dependent methyltransferase
MPTDTFDGYTYTTFPPRLYRRFVEIYIVPYGQAFTRCVDLGCGSGGLIQALRELVRCPILGVDTSSASIENCRKRSSLDQEGIEFLQTDILTLGGSFPNAFDLVVCYSVLHLVRGDTPRKFSLLYDLSKPGAIIAVDALARIPWNRFMFAVVKGLIRTGLWRLALKALAPVVGPSFPRDFMEDLSRMPYLRYLRYADFIDLAYFDSEEFSRRFELLRLDVVPQDGFLTGRKVRLALRRR